MKMAVESMQMASGAIPHPGRGAGIETSVPQTSSSMAEALRNFSWMDTDSFRVFESERIYRWKGNVRGHPGGPHHLVTRLGVTSPWPSSFSALDSIFMLEK
jgi:hypothetical protein